MQPDFSLRVFAPAKINLALHVTGRRQNGYHLLDSLVAFADVGDELILESSRRAEMKISGPEADTVPRDNRNLVLQVANLFEGRETTSFFLTKNLPVSSGIGGGSADAAAAFRGLTMVHGTHMSGDAILEKKLLHLGADIPMCLQSRCARITGIGEIIEPLNDLPELHAVLVNPRRAVSTPAVFQALEKRENSELSQQFQSIKKASDLILWLKEQRNDLEEAAIGLETQIGDVKAQLASDPNCRLARMSGSGATCFGLFNTALHARAASDILRKNNPEWWVEATTLGNQFDRAKPQSI